MLRIDPDKLVYYQRIRMDFARQFPTCFLRGRRETASGRSDLVRIFLPLLLEMRRNCVFPLMLSTYVPGKISVIFLSGNRPGVPLAVGHGTMAAMSRRWVWIGQNPTQTQVSSPDQVKIA